MGDFSQSPLTFLKQSLEMGYVGVHIEQGVPILDRDLNLMHDLVSAVVRAITTRYIGNGIAADQDGFEIVELPGADNDFTVEAGPSDRLGTCLVHGIEITIKNSITYKSQTDGEPALADLTTPGKTQPRTDIVFLDVWLAERDSNDDPHLRNPSDVGIQTSVRLRPMWVVRVAEGTEPPEPLPSHAHYPLARLERTGDNSKITKAMIHDLRQRRLTLMDLEQRVQDIERLRTMPAFHDTAPLTPPFGAPTSEVDLNGRNFDIGTPKVKFGDVDAASVIFLSPTKVKAIVPEGPPGKVPVTIKTGGGQAVSSMLFDVRGRRPEITSISPKTGKPATSTGEATPVTINGNHFKKNVRGETVVTFGTVPAVIDPGTFTDTKIVTRVPIVPSGELTITVETEWGTSRGELFTIVQGIPS